MAYILHLVLYPTPRGILSHRLNNQVTFLFIYLNSTVEVSGNTIMYMVKIISIKQSIVTIIQITLSEDRVPLAKKLVYTF